MTTSQTVESGGKTRNILYVEDEPINIHLMEIVVGAIPDLEMLTAPTAEHALTQIAERRPDLILMDINLPGIDGVEALIKLRSEDDTKDIPVIALTANSSPADIKRGEEAGFDSYITKPIKVQDVLDTINSLLK